MRVKIEGKKTPEEASQAVLKVLQGVLKNYSDIRLRGLNFYFTFVNSEGEEVQLCDKDGNPIEMLMVPDESKPKKLPKKQPDHGTNIVKLPSKAVKTKANRARTY
jgi:hypothetical protein